MVQQSRPSCGLRDGRYGAEFCRRNTLDGPGYADVDLRCSRDIFLLRTKADKGPVATVALDAFNLFNRVNYAAYIGNLSSPFFGQAVSSLPARRLQLTVRLKF